MRYQTTVNRPVEIITGGVSATPKRLDLVVPFTTPELTRAALDYAHKMGAGLDSQIRVVRVQVVPFPLAIDQSPVAPEFLTKQMLSLGLKEEQVDLRFARDYDAGLDGALQRDSVVVLASKHRPWPTRNERLAAKLRAKGHTVCLM
jgi:hypothetical protein